MAVPKRSAVLTLLGVGTCLPSRARRSPAYHLDVAESRILLDCGPGTLHAFDAHDVGWKDLTHVVVSHYHADHIGDLPAVLFALKNAARPPRAAPLTLIGPPGFGAFVRRLADVLGEHLVDPGFELHVVDLEPGTTFKEPGGDFALEPHRTPHTEESLAFRIAGDWGALGYTGDTGPSPALGRFLAGCDVVVAECSLPDPPSMDRHLSPALLADLADAARPDLLVVTHVYPPLSPDEAVRLVGERYRGAAVAGAAGMRIRIGSEDGPGVDLPPTARYT